jgi:hypothetical protein
VPKLTPEEATQKWVTRTSAATADVQRGIERVTEAPGRKAAQKVDKYRTGVANSVDKWQRNVGRVSLDDWKQAAIGIGVQRIAQGVQAKQGKMESFARDFYPHLAAGQAKVAAMPDNDINSRIQRAVAMMLHNADFRRRG